MEYQARQSSCCPTDGGGRGCRRRWRPPRCRTARPVAPLWCPWQGTLSRRGRSWAAAGCLAAAPARVAGPERSSWPPPARGRPVPPSPLARVAEASPAPAASSSSVWTTSLSPSAAALPASSSYPSGAAAQGLVLLLKLWWLPLLPCRRRVGPAVVGVELLVGRGKWRTWWRWVGAAGAAVGWTAGEEETTTSISSEASRMETRERRSTRHLCAGDDCMAGTSGRSCTSRRPAPPASRQLAPAGCDQGTSSGTQGFC